MGPVALTEYMAQHPTFGVAFSLLRILLGVALFVTIRRSNGFAAVHELLSGTRVVMRHAMPALRAAAAISREEERSGSATLARPATACGPFEITGDLGEVPGGRLLSAFDHRLRRRVWIRAVPVGTPAVSDVRRDISRVGRLRWLAGRRSADENWDAFEAPTGAGLLSGARVAGPAPSEVEGWSVAKQWLLDLVAELRASHEDRSTPALGLDAVWIRTDGRAVLLDFPAPRLGLRPHVPHRDLTPIGFLAAVSEHVLGDELTRNGNQSAPSPIPISAIALLQRWSRGPTMSLDEARAALTSAAAAPDGVPRLRRAIPITLTSLLVALAVAGSVAIVPTLYRTLTPELFELYSLLQMAQGLEGSDGDAALKRRHAIDVYVAGHFRSVVEDDVFWANPGRAGLVRLRPTGVEAVAAHPVISAEDLVRARDATAGERAKSRRATPRASLLS